MLTGKARYLKKLYKNSMIKEINLENAVSKGWITKEEKNEIINS